MDKLLKKSIENMSQIRRSISEKGTATIHDYQKLLFFTPEQAALKILGGADDFEK